MPKNPPRLPENYADAALRHWHDAAALAGSRTPAADHHIGIAAECALKHAICVSTGSRALTRDQKVHADELWGQAAMILNESLFPDPYTTLNGANPFATWQIADRYAGTAAVTADIEIVENGVSRRETRCRVTGLILRQAELMV